MRFPDISVQVLIFQMFRIVLLDVVQYSLFAAGDIEQLSIVIGAPVPGESLLPEREVECLAMNLLGFGQRTVDIENNSLDYGVAARGRSSFINSSSHEDRSSIRKSAPRISTGSRE
jgi:hypothetical protein